MTDFYQVLGVPRTASIDDIQKAYRLKAKEHHPDRNPGDADAQHRFREIQDAYDTLSDPAKKDQYDRGGRSFNFRSHGNGFNADPFGDMNDMMQEMFRQSTFHGRNLQTKLEISFEEAFLGCRKEIIIRQRHRCATCSGHGQTSTENCAMCNGQGFVNVNNAPFEIRTSCPNCNATGKLNSKPCSDCNATGHTPGYKEKKIEVVVPAGIDNGAIIRIKGEGETSLRGGGRPGDMMVHIVVAEHPIYRKNGSDLIVDIPVSYTELALGTDIEFPHFNNEKIVLRIPAGTQTGTRFKVPGKGGMHPNGTLGDLVVTLKVETVKNPDEKYRKVLEELAKCEREKVDTRRAAWQKKTTPPPT